MLVKYKNGSRTFSEDDAGGESESIPMQQEETKKLRRIKQISVKNLFGIFNHTIPLNMDERITIIHGPNGFGKTMMLKLLYALFSTDNQILQTIPFDEFRVSFEDDNNFWISKTTLFSALTETEKVDEAEIIFHATGKKPFSLRSRFSREASSLAQLRDILLKLDKSETQLAPFLKDAIEEPSYYRSPTRFISAETKMLEWLVEMRKSVPIRFIETQRLLNSSKSFKHSKSELKEFSEYAVTEDAKNIAEIIQKKLAESASLSQSLDRTFPARLINPTNQQLQLEETELRDKLARLEEKRKRLMATGLLDQEVGPTFPISANTEQEINPNTKAVLAVYVDDTEQKLHVFDEPAQKIDLLTTIINNRFLFKKMTIDREQGLVFTSTNGTILPLEDLSSGEQHELVLFYELLFKTNPGSFILIDEPELSLHVVWQEQFLKDIQQVAHLTNIDVILATHSPDIINDRRDLVVELEGPKNGSI